MSGGRACRNRAHRQSWRVMQRQCNHSAFNGYRLTYSEYSTLICMAPGCTGCWRTRAAYVGAIPDYKEAER